MNRRERLFLALLRFYRRQMAHNQVCDLNAPLSVIQESWRALDAVEKELFEMQGEISQAESDLLFAAALAFESRN